MKDKEDIKGLKAVEGKNFDTERKIKQLVNPFETNEKTRSTFSLEKSKIDQQIDEKLCSK
jgi:hypothetical protein